METLCRVSSDGGAGWVRDRYQECYYSVRGSEPSTGYTEDGRRGVRLKGRKVQLEGKGRDKISFFIYTRVPPLHTSK